MTLSATRYHNLAGEIEIQPAGTISRTLYQDDFLKVILFGFDSGEELSEHTAAVPAVVQILEGQVSLTLGDETMEASAGSFIHMPAQLPHSVSAKLPTKMLLLLLKGAKDNG